MVQIQQKRVQKRKLVEVTKLETPVTLKTPTKQNQITEQKQSFALVQTLLLASIATFASLRGLFPLECFERRNYIDIHKDAYRLYQRFHHKCDIASNDKEEAPTRLEDIEVPWIVEVLIRGKTSGSDRLLDWVNEILEGLLRKNLAAVQFSIITGSKDPLEILESYTFNFQYLENDDNTDRQLVGLTFHDPHGEPVTIISARYGLLQIVHHLIKLNVNLPALPATKFLKCHFFHRLEASQVWLPRGFQSCKEPISMLPDKASWATNDLNLGAMNTGFHHVGLTVAYNIARPKPEKAVSLKRAKRNGPLVQRRPLSSILRSKGRVTESPQAKVYHPIDLHKSLSKFDFHEDTETKSNGDIDCVTKLVTDSLVLTQELNTDNSWEPMRHMRLVPLKKMEIDKKRESVRYLLRNSKTRIRKSVRCECGFDQDEGEMLLCDCCNAWQHYHCYGFILELPRKGEPHYCYHCLLEDTDELSLAKLGRLARFRRALWILYYESSRPVSQPAFAKLLHYDGKATAHIVQQMKDEGYLVRSTRSSLVLVDSVEQLEIMRNDYCNPMTMIKSHYFWSKEGDWSSVFSGRSEAPSRKRLRRSIPERSDGPNSF